MSTLTLHDGTAVEVDVYHSKRSDPGPRTTRVRIRRFRKDGDQEVEVGPAVEGLSTCSIHDNFDRGIGRYQAILRAFEHDPGHTLLPREVRRRIFALVVPRVKPQMKAVRHQARSRVAYRLEQPPPEERATLSGELYR